MQPKVFRTTTVVFAVACVIAGAAALSIVGDVGWDEKFVAMSAAVAPWFIALNIVWATGEIIGAIKGRDAE